MDPESGVRSGSLREFIADLPHPYTFDVGIEFSFVENRSKCEVVKGRSIPISLGHDF